MQNSLFSYRREAFSRAYAVDTRQHFPEVSPRERKLRKQFPKEGDSGSIFFGVKEFPRELCFEECNPKELEGDFGGNGGDFGDDLSKKEERLAMVVSPTVIQA